MFHRKAKELRLNIGGSAIAVICPSKEFAEWMSGYFGASGTAGEPDLVLRLKIVDHGRDAEIPDSLFNNKSLDGDKFNIADNLARGSINRKKNRIDIQVKSCLMSGALMRVFEQIMYQAYYNCCRLRDSDSVLVHSSGVIYKGDGFLFFGPSGAGKSTIANLSGDHHVLNDEVCLLEFTKDGIVLHGTPFNGFFKQKKEGSAPLRSIFHIGHGNAHDISSMEKTDAVKSLAYQIIPPIGLHEIITPLTFIDMLDKAERIDGMVTIKKLDFLPDKGFWREIDNRYYKGTSNN